MIALVMVLGVLGGVLVGCSGGEKAADNAAGAGNAAPAAGNTEPAK